MQRLLGLSASLAAVLLVGCSEPPGGHAPPQTQASGTPADEPSQCPSFDELGLKVDRRVDAIRPGVTLREFTTTAAVTRALNFWDEVPGSLRETVFFMSAGEGNAIVSDNIVCRFDSGDRLVSCERVCCRAQSRTVTLEQYNSLRLGESRSAVEGRLCSPSWVETESASRVKTYYHVPLPVGHHDEGQAVMLVFDHNELSFKDMNPYY